MLTKAEKTTKYIIEKAAPYFNKYGYTATSLSDITKATGLSKGAVYGNFKDKEELALQSFNYNIRRAIGLLRAKMTTDGPALTRLKEITNFFRNYYQRELEFGGCPMMNVGIDSLHHNERLHQRVVHVMNKLIHNIAVIIEDGKLENTIIQTIDSHLYANKIYAQIQGGIFLSNMLGDDIYISSMMDQIDHMIDTQIAN